MLDISHGPGTNPQFMYLSFLDDGNLRVIVDGWFICSAKNHSLHYES